MRDICPLSVGLGSFECVSSNTNTSDHDQTLRLFKRRADDLFECSLAQREDSLELGQQLHMKLRVDKETGRTLVTELRQAIPPKEQVAYALTLLRPLTLKKDRLAWPKVLNALEQSSSGAAGAHVQMLSELRTAWDSYPARRMRIMQAPIDSIDAEPTVDAWDNEIARKFLYGDLVHGDDNSDLLDALGDDQVVFSAAAMASDGFRLVNNTYQLMHWLRPDVAPEEAFFSLRASAAQESDGVPQHP